MPRTPFALVLGLLVAAACWTPRGKLAVTVPLATPTGAARTPCDVAAELRRDVPELSSGGRVDRVVRTVERADKLCPATADQTRTALEAARAELSRGGDPDALLEQASQARSSGDTSRAWTLSDRALAEAERRAGSTVVARVRSSSPRFELTWLPDGEHVFFLEMNGAHVVEPATGRTWGPLAATALADRRIEGGPKDQIALMGSDEDDGCQLRIVDWRRGRDIAKLPAAGSCGASDGILTPSPDGALLAFWTKDGDKAAVALWDWAAGRVARTLPPPSALSSDATLQATAFTRDGRGLMASWDDGSLALYDVASGKGRFLDDVGVIREFLPDAHGDWIAWRGGAITAPNLGAVRWSSGAPIHLLGSDAKKRALCPAIAIGYAPAGHVLLSANDDWTECVIDLQSRATRRLGVPHVFSGMGDDDVRSPQAIAMSADGKRITVTWNTPTSLEVLDAATGRVLIPFPPDTDFDFPNGAISPDGSLEIGPVGTDELGAVEIATRTLRWRVPYEGHGLGAAFTPDGRRVAVDDGVGVRVLDVTNGQTLSTPKQAPAPPDLHDFALDPSGPLALTTSDSVITRLDLSTGTVVDARPPPEPFAVAHLGQHPFWASSPHGCVWLDGERVEPEGVRHIGVTHDLDVVTVSADGSRIAAELDGRGVSVWSHSGELVRNLPDAHQPIALSPDGHTLASIAQPKTTLRVSDISTGEILASYPLSGRPESLEFALGERIVVATQQDPPWTTNTDVLVLDVRNGRAFQTARAHSSHPLFSGADAASEMWTLADAEDGSELTEWSLGTGKPVAKVPLEGPAAANGRASFVPGHSMVALMDVDGNLAFVNRSTGKRVVSLRPVVGGAVALSPEGGVDLLGDVARGREALMCQVAVRSFPFELCEDRVLDPGMWARVMVPHVE